MRSRLSAHAFWWRVAAVVAIVGMPACAPQPPPAPSLAGQPSVAREAWLVLAGRELRRESCMAGAHFRRCSEITRDECDHVISLGLRRCSETWGRGVEDDVVAGAADRRRRDELRGCVWHHAGMELGPARLDMLCVFTPR